MSSAVTTREGEARAQRGSADRRPTSPERGVNPGSRSFRLSQYILAT